MNALDGLSIAILLAVIGSLLVVAEVFFPSGGLLGFLSAAAFIGAVYSAYTSGGLLTGLTFAAVEVVLAPLLIFITFAYLPKTPMGRVLIGAAPTDKEVRPDDTHESLVGRVGVARTKMLPAGSIEIDGRMLDAVSQGQAIDPGEYVKIVESSGNHVAVRRAAPNERPDQGSTPAENPLHRPAEELGLESFEFDKDA
ncbi:hypothetical protein MalM25_28770 [Planctomycetes bacterium MalM25]|nr:hypothetical protein MalM25_28770 [Planctomycetes bacterium MalM25]